MKENPRVSVIIPTHNHAHFLPECLASVKAQTYKDYEVIVINNGSTDNTEQAISHLAWDNLRYHYQRDTGSVAGPRNTGIHLAKGEYAAFLDSDDLWYEKKLEKAMAILEANSAIDILSHDLFLVVSGKKKMVIKTGPLRKDMFKNLFVSNRLLGSATIAKTDMMRQVGGFDENKDFVHAEDYETWLRLAYLGKNFYFINEPLGEYRVHATNLSLDFKSLLQHEKNVIDKHFKNLKSRIPLCAQFLYRNRIAINYFKMGTQFFCRKKYGEGAFYFLRSFFLSPFCFLFNLVKLFWEVI